jgi:hypothetical protein
VERGHYLRFFDAQFTGKLLCLQSRFVGEKLQDAASGAHGNLCSSAGRREGAEAGCASFGSGDLGRRGSRRKAAAAALRARPSILAAVRAYGARNGPRELPARTYFPTTALSQA